VHIVDTQNLFFQIYKRNFLHELGVAVGQIIALPAKIQRWLIQLYLVYTSENKLFIGLKEGFLWGMCRKRGYVFCGQKLKGTTENV